MPCMHHTCIYMHDACFHEGEGAARALEVRDLLQGEARMALPRLVGDARVVEARQKRQAPQHHQRDA